MAPSLNLLINDSDEQGPAQGCKPELKARLQNTQPTKYLN